MRQRRPVCDSIRSADGRRGTHAEIMVSMLLDALVLVSQLNLDSSRSLAKFDALVLLVSLLDSDIRAITSHACGRGRRRPRSKNEEKSLAEIEASTTPEKFLEEKLEPPTLGTKIDRQGPRGRATDHGEYARRRAAREALWKASLRRGRR